MRSLLKSSSDPSLSAHQAVKATTLSHLEAGQKKYHEGTLYVARSTDLDGTAHWEPYRFKHNRDGSLSLTRPHGRGGSGREVFLDADWRQPFVAAPWKALTVGEGTASRLASSGDVSQADGGMTDDGNGQELFPFTLSYAPLQPRPGDHPVLQQRRTVVLAATTAKGRRRWLEEFSQKSRAPELRTSPPVNTLINKVGSSMPPTRRRFAALGERHTGLPTAPPRESGVDSATTSIQLPGCKKLAAGQSRLFESSSKLRIVRDLYDGYASDPLTQAEQGKYATVSSIVLSHEKHTKCLRKYLDRQAAIEKMLEQHWNGATESLTPLRGVSTSVEEPSRIEGASDAGRISEEQASPSSIGGAIAVLPPSPGASSFRLIAMTPNLTFNKDVLGNDEWSGGAILMPPDPSNFEFTVLPLNDLDTHPLFIGIAPENSDLSVVNFFDVGGGAFLCMGGTASASLIASLGAFGGPCFHIFGERSVAKVHVPPRGYTLSVHYNEENGEGKLRFSVGDKGGIGVHTVKPRNAKRIPPGGWRPCILLCTPETQVQLLRLQ